MRYSGKPRRKLLWLAALATATCFAFGPGCLQAVLATIGASFF